MQIKDGGSQKYTTRHDPHGFSMRITAKCGILSGKNVGVWLGGFWFDSLLGFPIGIPAGVPDGNGVPNQTSKGSLGTGLRSRSECVPSSECSSGFACNAISSLITSNPLSGNWEQLTGPIYRTNRPKTLSHASHHDI